MDNATALLRIVRKWIPGKWILALTSGSKLWLAAMKSDLRPLNIDSSYARKKTASREHWRSIVDKKSLPWRESNARLSYNIYIEDDKQPNIVVTHATLCLREYSVLATARCLCLSTCHKPVFYRNRWTYRAGFWSGGFFRLILHCVIKNKYL